MVVLIEAEPPISIRIGQDVGPLLRFFGFKCFLGGGPCSFFRSSKSVSSLSVNLVRVFLLSPKS